MEPQEQAARHARFKSLVWYFCQWLAVLLFLRLLYGQESRLITEMAAGVSGESAAGYLSGNGLLTATVLGRLAGKTAAAQA